MKLQEIKKYLGIFGLAVAIIIVYKTFDNFGIILDFLATLLQLLTPFFIGAAIAFVLRTPCKGVEKLLRRVKIDFFRKYRRGFSVLTVYVLVLAAIALIITAIAPQLAKSISKFMEQLPSMLKALVDWINSLGIYNIENITVEKLLESDFLSFNKIFEILNFDNMDKYAKSVINVGSTIVDIFLGIIISVYMQLERKSIKRNASKLARIYLPEKLRKNISFYAKMVGDFINRYIGCQLLDACIVFVLCLIALSIMNTEYAAVIALMVGSFNLIPYFGAFVAVVIGALITLVTGGFMKAIILVIVLVVIQQIDANIIQPRLVASSLSIKPLLVILGVVIGGGFFGVLGMFLGVPFVALIKNICSDLINKKAAVVKNE